jgi:hypothetical protein
MKHPETHCDCIAPATSLAQRWRCPDCGRGTILRLPIIEAICDGVSLSRIEAHQNARLAAGHPPGMD